MNVAGLFVSHTESRALCSLPSFIARRVIQPWCLVELERIISPFVLITECWALQARLTGVKKLSATKRALAFNCKLLALDQVSVHALKAILTNSFISEISLSTSSMNCMMKSTSLCFNISSVWKFVIKNEMS